jgi:hypothetical protein
MATLCKIKNATSQVRYSEIAGILKNLQLAKPMNKKNNATAPSVIAPDQQTGEPYGIN